MAALGIDPFDGLQICDATILAQRHHPNLDPDVAALVVQLYHRHLAADVKITLMNLYPDDHPLRLVRGAGTPEQAIIELPLYELDRRDDLDHLTSVYIPPLGWPGSLATYQDVVARLRAPGGCPWDRQQTHQSLRPHLLEEAYEVLAALDADDPDLLREELGDLLLQVFLHAQIATEGGDFKLI
ncbi:MAG: MazG family protein, partial [Chloroflexi bacterium]|nr:MazG family protein [Chloroflexota bacterium]